MNYKAEELRGLSDKDIHDELSAAHRELFNLRFQVSTHQAANTADLGKVRRKIARILTILREREFTFVE